MEMRREFVVVGAMTAARHRDGGAVSGKAIMGRRRQSLDPKAAAVVSRSGEKRSLDHRCSDLEGCRHQTEDAGRSVWPTDATSRAGQKR